MPPYTTSSSGRSATSGSRLFWIIRYGASASHERQLSSVPRGARMLREGSRRGSGRDSGMEGSGTRADGARVAGGRRDYRIAPERAGYGPGPGDRISAATDPVGAARP